MFVSAGEAFQWSTTLLSTKFDCWCFIYDTRCAR